MRAPRWWCPFYHAGPAAAQSVSAGRDACQHTVQNVAHPINLCIADRERRHEAQRIRARCVEQQTSLQCLCDDRPRDIALQVESQKQAIAAYLAAAVPCRQRGQPLRQSGARLAHSRENSGCATVSTTAQPTAAMIGLPQNVPP